MGEISFGSTSTSVTGYTDNWVRSTGISLPQGRAAANGGKYAKIYRLRGYLAGRGASRSMVMSLGSAVTGSFTEGAASAASSTGWKSCSDWLVTGGSATFTEDGNGSFYFGRGGSGSATDSYGYVFSGTLGGGAQYTESPTNPYGLSATPNATTPGAIDLEWSTPVDNGGDSITGYRIEYADNASFTGATAKNVGVTNSDTVTGLTPGVLYYFRIAAKNEVTTLAGTWSAYSGSASALARSGMKVWTGTEWKSASVRVWDGSAWQPATIKVWDGAAWQPAQ